MEFETSNIAMVLFFYDCVVMPSPTYGVLRYFSNYPLHRRVRHIKWHPKPITLEWRWVLKSSHSESEPMLTCIVVQPQLKKSLDIV